MSERDFFKPFFVVRLMLLARGKWSFQFSWHSYLQVVFLSYPERAVIAHETAVRLTPHNLLN
jgi:hypothetical protein